MKDLLLCGIDFETTGLDLVNDRIVEIGAVLWDARAKAPIRIFNTLIKQDTTDEALSVSGLTKELLEVHGRVEAEGMKVLIAMMKMSNAIVAHNGTGFDRPIFDNHCQRLKESHPPLLWIDTATDVPYPETITTRKLIHLAAEHGFLNPFAHRAVFDVLTMLRVLSCYDIDAVIETAKQPTMTLIANVSYDDREKAKARGYRWQAENKLWIRHLKSGQVEAERSACGFHITVKDFTPTGI